MPVCTLCHDMAARGAREAGRREGIEQGVRFALADKGEMTKRYHVTLALQTLLPTPPPQAAEPPKCPHRQYATTSAGEECVDCGAPPAVPAGEACSCSNRYTCRLHREKARP